MNIKEVKEVIEGSIFNPTMRRDAKDFIDAQETRIAELEAALENQTRYAEFMANVWQLLRRSGWLKEVEITNNGGDLEGVDFVAQRILGMQS